MSLSNLVSIVAAIAARIEREGDTTEKGSEAA